MQSTVRRRAAHCALALLALNSLTISACNDDSTDPRTPTTLAVVSGDVQTAVAGVALASPFVVIVTDQDGLVMTGVTVTWAITTGSGTLGSASTVTDVNGQTSTTYTTGTTAGTETVSASVSGLTSVTFTVSVTSAETSLTTR